MPASRRSVNSSMCRASATRRCSNVAPSLQPVQRSSVPRLPTLDFFGEPQSDSVVRRVGVSIGQNIYTPKNTSTPDPILDDRPYAGWSYVGFALQYIYTKDNEPIRLDSLQLDLGVVGPAAGGRFVQNNFHHLIGVDQSEGWDNQLHNRFAANFMFERRWRTGRFKIIEDPGLEVDFIPSVGGAVGNVEVYGSVGGYIRIGNDLRNDFGPPRPAPSLPGSETFTANDDFGWYLFAGFQGQVYAYNMLIDRHAFHGGPDLDRRIFTGDVSAGLAIIFRNLRLSYTHIVRAPEFKERNRIEQYGSISLAIRY